MTGLGLLKQVYSLLGDEKRLANVGSDDVGLSALNQIYGELWHREHKTAFVPLGVLQQPIKLSWRALPALSYGTAMLLCVGDAEKTRHDRFLTLYRWASARAGGVCEDRRDTLWGRKKA